MPPKGYVRLRNLRPGAIFETLKGKRKAVKSEYIYPDGHQCQCINLETGEYAHFVDKDETWVKEICLPEN